MAITAAITAIASIGFQIDAQNQQKKANKEQQKKQRSEAIKERRQQIRQQRIARAQAASAAAITGGEGSVLSGAQSSIANQFAQNTAFIEANQRANENIFKFTEKASQSSMIAGALSTASSFASANIKPKQTPTPTGDQFGFTAGQDPFNPANFSR